LVVLVRRCLHAVRGTAAKVLVNDRIDVSVAAQADGVHLRSDSIDAFVARTVLPPEALLGRSVHSVEEAVAATRAGGIDYLILGTLFQTASKDSTHSLTTLDDLSAVSRMSAVPVLAIGGMTLERAPAVAQAGASGVAGIGLFIPADGQRQQVHLRAIVAGLRRVFDTCGAVP
ncbi:MAG TPA: thiamine phosphate synthase, partial [Vicinamibacterales bacterium]|nr:thiamine phosphate synthase [Vicinamibacterales bacterium]